MHPSAIIPVSQQGFCILSEKFVVRIIRHLRIQISSKLYRLMGEDEIIDRLLPDFVFERKRHFDEES